MSQQPSILVIDDESGILDTLRILLKNEGFDVTTAQGGKAGLEQLKASTTGDLVIVATFTELDEDSARRHQPRVVLVDAQNRPRQAVEEVAGPQRR